MSASCSQGQGATAWLVQKEPWSHPTSRWPHIGRQPTERPALSPSAAAPAGRTSGAAQHAQQLAEQPACPTWPAGPLAGWGMLPTTYLSARAFCYVADTTGVKP